MVNKTFIVIILTILVLGVIFHLVSSCCNGVKEGFQGNNGDEDKDETVRYFADLDDDSNYDFMTSNITKIKQKDVDGGRLKMFKFDGTKGFLYLTRIGDPKSNVSMKLEMDPNRTASQTLIDTNNYTLEYTPTSIKFRYGTGKNSRKDFVIPQIEDYSVLQMLVLNFNRIGGTITIGFGPEGNMTSYTSEDNVSGGFSNENNYMYFGRTSRSENYYKGFMGNIVITSRSQFQIQGSTTQATTTQATAVTAAAAAAAAASPTAAPGQTLPASCPTVANTIEEEDKDGFIIRSGNRIQYTNSFLESKTEENQTIPFPGLNKNVKMFKFNETSGFKISNINQKNLTVYFAIQFSQLDYDETIIEGDNFSVKIEGGNLVLTANNNKKAIAVKTRRMYFLIFIVNSRESTMTLKLDMFEESLPYTRQGNLREISFAGNVNEDTQFTGRMGNFIFVTRTYSIENVCDSSRLCQLVEDNCADYTEESKCNRSSNKQGTKCEYNVVCVPRVDSAEDRDRCAKHGSGVVCNNDDKCMVDSNQSQCRDAQPVDIIEDVSIPTYMALPTTTSTQDVSRPPPRNCSFKPEGQTRESCVDRCSNEFRSKQINEDCNPAVCRIICDKCTSPNCYWKSEESISNVKEPMVPVAPKIKAYSGDKQVKLLWVAPYSVSDMERYTCVVENNNLNQETRIEFPVDTGCKLCEHIIGSLKNGFNYNIYVIASNKEGDSLPSNVVAIMPREGKQLPDTGRKHDMEMNQLDDSLQEYKRVIDKGDYSALKKMANVDDHIDADYYELLDLLVSSKQNQRLINEKMKIEIVS